MCAWITLDKPSIEHIFSQFLCHRKGISLAARTTSIHPENIGMTRIFWWVICSVQSLGRVWLFATPWTSACQASLSITYSQSLLKLISIESVMPSNHLVLCSTLFLPSIFLSIRVFSNESAVRIRWPKYWSFSIRISNEYSGLISFRIDWFDLLVGQWTLKNLLQHHSSKASILWRSAFFMVQLSHSYRIIGNHNFD